MLDLVGKGGGMDRPDLLGFLFLREAAFQFGGDWLVHQPLRG